MTSSDYFSAYVRPARANFYSNSVSTEPYYTNPGAYPIGCPNPPALTVQIHDYNFFDIKGVLNKVT